MSELMIVDPAILKDAPKAFQDYVKEFFKERELFGKKCFVAARLTSYDWRHEKGIAPSHGVDLMRFKGGLPDGMDLNEWIRQQEKKKAGIWSLYGPDPDPHPIECD
jgi:hypothetical protein